MVKPWVCPTCRTSVDTLHCPTCGERALQLKDLTFLGLLTQGFHTLSSIDSRLLQSLKLLLTRPGALTNAYVLGPRKPYIVPLQLFLIVNVAFFAVQAFGESPMFSTSLNSHLHHQDWSAFARDLVAHKLAATHTSLAAYTPVFNHAVDVNARALVSLLVLPFTLLLIPLFATSHRAFVTHLVFALHLLAFLLLCSCMLLLLTLLETSLGGSGLRSTLVDWGAFAVLVAVIATYLYIATGVVYGAAGVVRALKVALLAVVIAAAVPGYRFLIFLVTVYYT